MILVCTLAAGLTSCNGGESRSSALEQSVAALTSSVVRATLKSPKGEVLVKRASADDWTPGRDGMALYDDDKVRTVRGASAQIQFVSGSVVALDPDALVGIAETHLLPGRERTDVTVLKGRVNAALENPAKQSLSLSTPAATVRAGREIVFQ